MKLNCWEFMKCGREPRGFLSEGIGVCAVCLEKKLDGVHGGKNAGRACWAVAGIACEGKVTGSFATDEEACFHCKFFQLVKNEEDGNLKRTMVLMDMIHRT